MGIFLFLFEKQLSPLVGRSLRRIGIAAALFALVLVAGHFALEPARMGGALSGVFDPVLRQIVLESPAASTFSWRVGGLVVIIAAMARGTAPGRWIALFGASGLLFSFAQAGHTTGFTPRLLAGGLLLIHIAIAAFWFGSFVPLRRVALDEQPGAAGRLVESFSRLALVLVPGLAAAGVALACLLLGSWKDLASPYGRLILVKIALFAGMLALGAMNRWRFGPALARGTPAARQSFIRAVLSEYILGAAVLVITAVLTGLYSPGA
jgi:putative copper export protein